MNDTNDNYYDCLVLIGRFQPFHSGHLQVIRAGLERAAMLIIICGSARQPRSIRNPWNEHEREQMMRGSLTEAENNRIHIVPVMDNPYDEQTWAEVIKKAANTLARAVHAGDNNPPRIGLISHNLHHSGYYQRLFPEWQHTEVPDYKQINATAIRKKLFAAKGHTPALAYLHGEQARDEIPVHVIRTLEKFCAGKAFTAMQSEYEYISRYRESWSSAPYPPIFVTVDNIIVQGDYILLIERDDHPGKGLLAMPGGFVNEYEPLVDACLRELREETSLDITPPELKKLIRKTEVFDYPYRSARGRIITHVFYIALDPDRDLPGVKGGDDARHAQWLPLADLDPAVMLEDHYFIIRQMLSD